jgi:hypothetical protein
MVLSVTGKHMDRIQKILRSGTVVFHFYRYWWEGFEAGEADLQSLLATFPDPDPSRVFSSVACTIAILEAGIAPRHQAVELPRAAASQKGLLRGKSFWDVLMSLASAGPLAYQTYSYMHRADLYRLELDAALRAKLAAAVTLAPRNLRKDLAAIGTAEQLIFVCPRT